MQRSIRNILAELDRLQTKYDILKDVYSELQELYYEIDGKMQERVKKILDMLEEV